MRKLLISITVIILALTFFYSCTTQVEKPNDSRIEKPEPEPEPEDDPWDQIPHAPENLITTTKTHDTITISWDAVPNAYRYKVVFSTYGGDEQEFIVAETSFSMTLLNSQTLYEFKVYSGNLQGWSWWYSDLTTQTITVYGDVNFYRQGFFRVDDYSCRIYIDGYLVDSWSWGQGRMESTIPTLTGWRLFEFEYKYRYNDYWDYNYIWFYLTPSGISIIKKTGDLELQ